MICHEPLKNCGDLAPSANNFQEIHEINRHLKRRFYRLILQYEEVNVEAVPDLTGPLTH